MGRPVHSMQTMGSKTWISCKRNFVNRFFVYQGSPVYAVASFWWQKVLAGIHQYFHIKNLVFEELGYLWIWNCYLLSIRKVVVILILYVILPSTKEWLVKKLSFGNSIQRKSSFTCFKLTRLNLDGLIYQRSCTTSVLQ